MIQNIFFAFKCPSMYNVFLGYDDINLFED